VSAVGRGNGTSVVRASGEVVCERAGLADTPLSRLKGLLGRARLGSDEGLLIRPTSAIHTCFMRFPIDAVFLDRQLVVVGVKSELRPWRFASRRGAKAVLELAAGESRRRGIQAGERLELVDPVGAE
jgi:uncharacterized membrane protein (UPF0127 family)